MQSTNMIDELRPRMHPRGQPSGRAGDVRSKGQAVRFKAKFFNDQSGASAPEYALILAVIGTALVVGAITLGNAIGESINDTGTCLSTASAGSPVC